MTLAHLHLLLNHIPLISLPLALIFFCYGYYAKNINTQRFALIVLFITSALVLPVYFTGEAAEEAVEHLANNIEDFIHPHEEAAEISLVLTLAAGLVALASFWFSRAKTLMPQTLNISVIAITIGAILSLGYTGSLGGQIRHTEIRPGASAATNQGTDSEKQDKVFNVKEEHSGEKDND